MPAETAPRCAALARALDEPLAGTAPVAPRWVCLEHRGPWPVDVLAHKDPEVRAFIRATTAAGWRFLLVRRPRRGARSAPGPLRLLLTDTAPDVARTTQLTVEGPADLAGVALPGPGEPLPGEPVAEPLLLVCTHGRRDRCCALDGRALATAVASTGEPEVWECTHLGGHRFAPTALVLPTGYLYGRLDTGTAVAARKAAEAGEVETALCRGRSTWSRAGQVAELAVRAETGLRDADVLAVEHESGDDVVVVVAARDGRRWAVAIEPVEQPGPRPASCGAGALTLVALRASGVRPLP